MHKLEIRMGETYKMKKIITSMILVFLGGLLFIGCSKITGGEESIARDSASDTSNVDNRTEEINQTQQEQIQQEGSFSEKELAQQAYVALMSGDNTLLDDASLKTWGVPCDFQNEGLEYEYTYLDLDGVDYNGSCYYTIFRYKSNGEKEVISYLFAREKLIYEDSTDPCPYYEINGKEVSKTEFDKQLVELITSRILDPSAWKRI